MTTAMTKVGGAAAAVMVGSLNRDQVELLKATICKGASDNELALFLEVCKAKRLDPFSGQIHAVKRKERDAKSDSWIEKMTYQVGIDGFRVMAERTGDRDGQDPPEWCGPDEVWKSLWLSSTPPVAARVRVWRQGRSRPYTGLAYWSFYVQTFKGKDGVERPNRMWERGGPHMLAKCAEALAYRMGFPEELAGLSAPEELEHVDNDRPTGAFQPAPAQPALPAGEAPPAAAPVDDGARALLERMLTAGSLGALEALLPELAKVPKASPAYKELRSEYGRLKVRLTPTQLPQGEPTGDVPPPEAAA